jgi:hypothetical protein
LANRFIVLGQCCPGTRITSDGEPLHAALDSRVFACTPTLTLNDCD